MREILRWFHVENERLGANPLLMKYEGEILHWWLAATEVESLTRSE
jgi:hypothetical protein